MDLFLFFFITDKKEADGAPHVVVMPTPSKRGRKKKATTLARVGPVGGPGHETLILAHLTAGGQVRTDATSAPNLIPAARPDVYIIVSSFAGSL